MLDVELQEKLNILHAGQMELFKFLSVELDLGFALLKTFETETAYDPPTAASALEKAKEALSNIRRFEGRIQNPGRLIAVGSVLRGPKRSPRIDLIYVY